MAGVPPQLNPQPGTPSGEWAAKTTSALDPSTHTPLGGTMNPTTAQLFEEKNMRPGTTAQETFGHNASAVSTPGNELPGAYPNREEMKPDPELHSTAVNTVTGTASNFAQSMSNAASQYLPAAAQTAAQYLPKSVVDGVRPYIPGMNNQSSGQTVSASEHDHPHKVSMPSQELTGAGERERVDGVGALPGAVGESNVTELPDQREGAQMPTTEGAKALAAGTAAGTATGVGAAMYGAKEKVNEYTPSTLNPARATKTTEITDHNTLPSQEPHGAQPFEHSSGVGSLPGKVTEAGVATLPDENARGATNATSSSVGTHSRTFGAATLPSHDQPTGVSGGVGALPGGKQESGVALLPDERSENQSGMGKWEHAGEAAGATGLVAAAAAGADANKGRKEPKIGEAQAMADRARTAGAEKQSEMTQSEPASAAGARMPQMGGEQPREAKEHSGAWDSGLGAKEAQGSEGKEREKKGPVAGTAGAAIAAGEKAKDKREEVKEKPKEAIRPSGQHEGEQQDKKEKEMGGAKPHTDASVCEILQQGLATDEEPREADVDSTVRGDPYCDPRAQFGEDHANDGDRDSAEHAPHQANLRQVTLRPRAHVLGAPSAQWGGVDVGSDAYKRGKDVDIGGDADIGTGYDTDYHPAAIHPPDADYSKEHQQNAEEDKNKEPVVEKNSEGQNSTSSATEHDRQPSSPTSEQGQKTKKAGFMAKMKGEAMVLLGKVEGKKGHDKVEEGQRIKAGEPAKPTGH